MRVRRLTAAGLSQFRMEPAAGLHGDRAIAAGVAANLWRKDAFQRVSRMGRRIGVGAIQAALRLLRRGAGEINLDRVAGDRDLDRVAQRRAERVVRDLGAVDAVGQARGWRRA